MGFAQKRALKAILSQRTHQGTEAAPPPRRSDVCGRAGHADSDAQAAMPQGAVLED